MSTICSQSDHSNINEEKTERTLTWISNVLKMPANLGRRRINSCFSSSGTFARVEKQVTKPSENIFDCAETIATPNKTEEDDLDNQRFIFPELDLSLEGSANSSSHSSSYSVDPAYCKRVNADLTWRMRVLLLDWMFEVSSELFLKRQTFYLAVNYVDWFFSKVTGVGREKIQCVGTAALYLSSKMEEINPPKLEVLSIATAGGSTK